MLDKVDDVCFIMSEYTRRKLKKNIFGRGKNSFWGDTRMSKEEIEFSISRVEIARPDHDSLWLSVR